VSQVALDRELCKACGICVALCPEHVFDRDALGYPVVAREDDCTACLLCEQHCPDFALGVARRPRKKAASPEEAAAAAQERVVAAVVGDHLETRPRQVAAGDAACGRHHEED